jgi:hypothetical protein
LASFIQGYGCLIQYAATCSDLASMSLPASFTHTIRTVLFSLLLLPLCLAEDLSALRHS